VVLAQVRRIFSNNTLNKNEGVNQYCPVLNKTKVHASCGIIPFTFARSASSSFSAPGLKMMRFGFCEKI
jgi:hypothetical protein